MDIKISDEMMKQMVSEKVLELAQDIVKSIDIESMIESSIDDMIENKYGWGTLAEGDNLDNLVTKSAEAETKIWLNNNIYGSDLDRLLREAIAQRFKTLPLDELVGLANKVIDETN